MINSFKDILYPLDHPKLAAARGLTPREFGKRVAAHPQSGQLVQSWQARLSEGYRGVTCDGTCEQGLYTLADQGAPVEAMMGAARRLLEQLSATQRDQLQHPIGAEQWRVWSNPEFLVNDYGLRLEDQNADIRVAILNVIAASLGTPGYAKARDCMRMNGVLGELTDLPLILNEWSYNFLLFGAPSIDQPWGWNIYGHHLTLNCFVLGTQMVISPTFMGAEPNQVDFGSLAGKALFTEEETLGLSLMRSLPSDLREKATVFRHMHDPAMPEGRWHPADERHLGAAFQDNRIVPYEGIPVSAFTPAQREQLLKLSSAFLEYLPAEPLQHRLHEIEQQLDRSWWSWIGGHGDDDPFYYRFQSPVVMIEFDHHSGIWLSNAEPAKCHIHTVVRTPNGNDYGKDLLRQHYQRVHPGRAPGKE